MGDGSAGLFRAIPTRNRLMVNWNCWWRHGIVVAVVVATSVANVHFQIAIVHFLAATRRRTTILRGVVFAAMLLVVGVWSL